METKKDKGFLSWKIPITILCIVGCLLMIEPFLEFIDSTVIPTFEYVTNGFRAKCSAGCGDYENTDCEADMCDSCCDYYFIVNGCFVKH